MALTVLVVGAGVATVCISGCQARHRHDHLDRPAEPPGRHMVSADVRINPPDLVSSRPDWLTILSWQGQMSDHRA
ncbi:hypothetical protein I552_0006 [Mycobacterium xenopi 3993]|nr:hypothetical protein I552_0006 [Mycobacterium xenopi 3993]